MKLIIMLSTLAAAIALAGGAATVSAAPSTLNCSPTVTLLPDLGFGSQGLAVQGDTVVGSVFNEAHRSLPAYWRDGTLTLIPGLPRGFAGDVNPRGDIVGSSGGAAPFIFLNGTTHLLPHPVGSATARRINARGQIAGTVGTSAARWDSYTSDPVSLLPADGDSFAFAKGINDVGQVAGDSDDANFAPRSAIWDAAGNLRLLASGFGTDQPSDLFAINNRGVSTGESFLAGDFGPTADQATRWSRDGDATLIPLLHATTASIGLELNDLGWVSGIAVDFDFATGEEHGHHAFVWFGDGPAETLPVPGLSYEQSESDAHDIDDNGTVVGSSGPAGGPDTATVWTCSRTQAYVAEASRRASFPGEPGRIAFFSNRDGDNDIYSVKQNGTGVVQLTTDPAADQFPSWSADGSRITFTSTRDGNAEIYVMNVDGSGQTRLTSNTTFEENPVFSPDATKITFASTRDAPISCPGDRLPAACFPYTEVYVMDADGTNVQRLTNNAVIDRFPIFAPDGSRIAFTSGPTTALTDLYVMNADGSDPTQITYRPGGDSQPNWSPDGARIAWRSSPVEHPEVGDIWVMNADGSDPVQLTDDPADDLRPAWSPSGAKIVFRSLRTNQGDIYKMKADGSKQEQVTDDPAQDAYPDWQPVSAEGDD